MIARFPGRCSCGADVAEGDAIRWDAEERRITGCEDCNFTGLRKATADMSCVRGGGRGLAAALRRRRDREQKRREKESGR